MNIKNHTMMLALILARDNSYYHYNYYVLFLYFNRRDY